MHNKSVLARVFMLLNVALPKQPIEQFQPLWQSRLQAQRAYCSNIFFVIQRRRKNYKPNENEEEDLDEVLRPVQPTVKTYASLQVTLLK